MKQSFRDLIAIYLTNQARDAYRNTPSNCWIICLKGEAELLPERVVGLHDNARLYIQPPYNDLSFKCGLWDYVNSQCETRFDSHEEELMDAETCLAVANAIDHFLNRTELSFKKRERLEFFRWMDALIALLRECHAENQHAELRL